MGAYMRLCVLAYQPRRPAMNVFLRFARYLAPHRLRIGLVLLFTALFVLANTAAYWLAASFLQALFTGGLGTSAAAAGSSLNDILKAWTASLLLGSTPNETLFRAALAIVLAFLLKNLFSYLQLFHVSFVEQRVIKQLRDELFAHLLRQDLAFFQTRRRGHLISTVLNDVES
ncbi:MAG TPA: ABC transporter ATP-binding protein, partial [Bacteroidetes bacterium]|nr:ABC transporter ATP-binding protein [Bacteroidota bacterium]